MDGFFFEFEAVRRPRCSTQVEHYWTALDKALGSFHRLKIEEINRIIKELWSVTYMGEDLSLIHI